MANIPQGLIKAHEWTRPGAEQTTTIDQQVAEMIQTIRNDGDQAIENFSQKFDQFTPEVITLKDYKDYGLDRQALSALETAAQRIQRFAEFQKQPFTNHRMQDEYGEYGQTIVPIESMAAYIPGGRFPLVSTALMTLIPAKVAGCQRRVAVSPSNHPALLAAASLAGATECIKIGGTQAIAALALGSQWAKKVDMIVGPGNAYVNSAKGQLQQHVKIDTLAGPSELLVIADKDAPLDWVKLDLLAQSEHDPLALSVCVSWDEEWLKRLHNALAEDSVGSAMLSKGNCQCVLAKNAEDATAFSNNMAPEHLSVMSHAIQDDALSQYGALFVGRYSAVAYGDYCSGPNHTLPTLGFARQKGGLYVGDFLKVLSYQSINSKGNQFLQEIGSQLADLEGLTLHNESMKVRQKD
ncbi:MAG: histidinol dehydrogenase [Pseudomonadota bacterium]